MTRETTAAAGADRVSDRVAARLLDQIARGDLAPGERLPGERQIAQEMGVSRVSVRAALQRLKAQGFLVAVQGGGTRVVSSAPEIDPPFMEMVRIKSDNLYDLAEIRLILESWAAGRAARHATPEQIEEIRLAVERMAQPGRGRLRIRDDAAFHVAIGKAAGSAVYMHILSVIRDTLTQMLEFQRYELFGGGEDETIIAQHRAIYDAIQSRQPEAASRAMAAHLSWVLDHYESAWPREKTASGSQAR